MMRTIRFLFLIIRLLFKTHSGLVLENLALRQQPAVMRGLVKPPDLCFRDRLFWVIPGSRRACRRVLVPGALDRRMDRRGVRAQGRVEREMEKPEASRTRPDVPGLPDHKGSDAVDTLSRRELIAEIEGPFAKGGYRVAGVTVEEVLVGTFREVPLYRGKIFPGKAPCDAQVWFRLRKERDPVCSWMGGKRDPSGFGHAAQGSSAFGSSPWSCRFSTKRRPASEPAR